MFIGSVPKPAIEQITRCVSFENWREVFVGCSGSFRFDRAVKDRYWSVKVHSNDVSLLSCGLGALATGADFPIGFTGRLAFVEDLVPADDFRQRMVAVLVALEMAKYRSDNPHARAHFAHYRTRFAEFMARADLVLAGCAILEAIRRAFPCPRLRVADRGLREGMLVQMMRADGVWAGQAAAQ